MAQAKNAAQDLINKSKLLTGNSTQAQSVAMSKNTAVKKDASDEGVTIKPSAIKLEAGTTDKLYVTWTVSGKNSKKTDHYEVQWAYSPTKSGSDFNKENSDTIAAGAQKRSVYTPPDNAQRVRVRIRAIAKKEKNKKGKEVYAYGSAATGATKWFGRDSNTGKATTGSWVVFTTTNSKGEEKEAQIKKILITGKYVIKSLTYTASLQYPIRAVLDGQKSTSTQTDWSWAESYDATWEFYVKDGNARYWVKGNDSGTYSASQKNIYYQGTIPDNATKMRLTITPISKDSGVVADETSLEEKLPNEQKEPRSVTSLSVKPQTATNRGVYATWTIDKTVNLEGFKYQFVAWNPNNKSWQYESESTIEFSSSTTIDKKRWWITPAYTLPDYATEVKVRVVPTSAETSGYAETAIESDKIKLTVDDRPMGSDIHLAIRPDNERTVVATWNITNKKDVDAFEYAWFYTVNNDNSGIVFPASTGNVKVTDPWTTTYDAPAYAKTAIFRIRPVPLYSNAFVGKWSSDITYDFAKRTKIKVSNLRITYAQADHESRTVTAQWDMADKSNVTGYEVKWRYTLSSTEIEGLVQTGTTQTIDDKDITNHRYQMPEKVSSVEVCVRPVLNNSGNFYAEWSGYVSRDIEQKTRTVHDVSITKLEDSDWTVRVNFDIDDEANVASYEYEYESFMNGVWNEPTVSTTTRKAFLIDAPNDCELIAVRVRPIDTSGSESFFTGVFSETVQYKFTIEPRTIPKDNIRIYMQQGSTTTVVAEWTPVDASDVANYSYKWQYRLSNEPGTVWYDGDEGTSSIESLVATYEPPAMALAVQFKVQPEPLYASSFSPEWSLYYVYSLPNAFLPETPEPPDVSIKRFNLTATITTYDTNTSSVEFDLVSEDREWPGGIAELIHNTATYTFVVPAGYTFNVRARGINADKDPGEWSRWSTSVSSMPVSVNEPISIEALSSTSVEVSWDSVESAESYTIEYASKSRYFDAAPDQVKSTTIESGTRAEINGLDPADDQENTGEWFFRIRCSNDQGDSEWTEPVSIRIGATPDAPTTWSSTTTAISSEDVYLYWLHNSADLSRETAAILELTINGNVYTLDIVDGVASEDEEADNTGVIGYDQETGEPIIGPLDLSELIGEIPEANVENQTIHQYVLEAGTFDAGAVVRWKVKTKGVLDDYSPWSTERQVNIYAPPSVSIGIGEGSNWLGENFEYNDENIYDYGSMTVTSIDGHLTTFPIVVAIDTLPLTQTPINYVITITANESYADFGDAGNLMKVSAGQELYRRFIYTNKHAFMTLIDAGDVNLSSGKYYTLTVVASLDSGLTAESSYDFYAEWLAESDVKFNVTLSTDLNEALMYIQPICVREDETYVENLLLSVYRIDFDGKFTEIATDLPNADSVTVTDLHPSLSNAKYRIVARNQVTGQTYYYDTQPFDLGITDIIIQWDEPWQIYDDESIDMSEYEKDPVWSGTMLRLPYNVDESESNDLDVELVNYIGREHPVSYYGTHVGQTASWKTDIPKADRWTIFLLRRLAVWPGDVYVRAPSGSGYWAHVKVNFDITHLELVVPISLDITRVEGGM